MCKKLIIASISARGFALAAHEYGYAVVTLDAFADSDTRQVSVQSLTVKLSEDVVDEVDFKQKLSQIAFDENCGFIYSSLFDAKPNLLTWVAERIKLIGNSAETMQICRSLAFFNLLDKLEIPYPKIQWDLPKPLDSWLMKRFFSTGGTHIKPALSNYKGHYFQRKIEGVPVSLLFLADGATAKVIGFNQQFISPSEDMPYRYAGGVSNLELAEHLQQQLIESAKKLTANLGLRGINSLDALLDGDELWILELNPRLSATFHLYPNLLQAHIQACAGVLMELPKWRSSKAQFILYADKTLDLSADFIWPDWVTDIPYFENGKAKVVESEPICTVFAEAQNAIGAQQLVLLRTKILKRGLFHDSK